MIIVEFFGIPRQRAGIASVTIGGETLGDVLSALANRFPRFACACLNEGHDLLPEYTANVGGDRFVRNRDISLRQGCRLLILSVDAGG